INLSTGEKLNISTVFEDYTVRIIYNGESYRDPANRYPLAMSIPTDVIIYEPDRQLEGAPPDKELLFQRLFPIGSYYLGDNVLDGSVTVSINGFSEYRYTFDPDSGTVNFMFPVPVDAQIEITYRTMAAAGLSGDLLMGLGSRFNFSDKFFLETGAGLRWNVLDSEYTEKAEEATGSILGTAGLSYTGDNLDFRLDAGISVHSPNTTGILRLAGMNKNGFSVPVTANLLYPSSPPESDVPGPLLKTDRGGLIYKDYHYYDSSGAGTLQKYDWPDIPDNQKWDYDTGNRIGPYIANAGSGDVAVFDYDLAANEWVGGRILITLGSKPLDLSSVQSISLQWMDIDATGSTKIYIRVGKLSEDLDGDLLLDAEATAYDNGFTYNDEQSAPKRIGVKADGSGGNNQIDTEVLNGNSILDGEGSDLILTMEDSRPDFVEPELTDPEVHV
ncbi:MAG: hypothetical protein KAR21_06430, partial [Spirochaetales bacterium]|nr:hypothetical protein [Spirochaetales bacterium]